MGEWPEHRGHPYFPGYFWDHYTEFPEVYDRFAMSTDAGVEWLGTLLDLSGHVLDMASGTGRSTFCLARTAQSVVGVEPDGTMRDYAIRMKRRDRVTNVQFVDGSTDRIPPFEPRSFDLVTCFHGPPFTPKGIPSFVGSLAPLTRPGGVLAVQTTTPGWLHEFQQALPADSRAQRIVSDPNRLMERAFLEHGFRFEDTTRYADHGSLEAALASYGFIYGPPAIDWLLGGAHAKIPWGLRTYLLTV